MNDMKEYIRKAMECKTADELLELAESWGVELTREQAEEYIANIQTRELTEEDFAQLAGGFSIYCGIFTPTPDCPVDYEHHCGAVTYGA